MRKNAVARWRGDSVTRNCAVASKAAFGFARRSRAQCTTEARHPRRHAPMDSEFTRFRINPALRDQAMQVCARLGVELSDVLRALVTRIAHDGAIPFAMPAAEPHP